MTARRGFTLVELLVALAVFAALAAAAYGGLAQIAKTRGELALRQDRLAAIVRAVSGLERDLGQAIARPVRGNYGQILPALAGGADHLELTRLGFANPRAEARSNLERVVYGYDNATLQRGRQVVLDLAPGSTPTTRAVLADVAAIRLRYLGSDGTWRDAWPPRDAAPETLPRAIELNATLTDFGELRRVIELPSGWPERAPESAGQGGPGTETDPLPGDPAPAPLPVPPGGVR